MTSHSVEEEIGLKDFPWRLLAWPAHIHTGTYAIQQVVLFMSLRNEFVMTVVLQHTTHNIYAGLRVLDLIQGAHSP